MALKCLMLETRDKKRFFTLLGNFKHLKGYCLAFGAKMFVVKAEIDRKRVLDLKGLVPALCDKNHKSENVNYKILESKKIK